MNGTLGICVLCIRRLDSRQRCKNILAFCCLGERVGNVFEQERYYSYNDAKIILILAIEAWKKLIHFNQSVYYIEV